MRSYNIHEAKTQLSKLVELAEADQRRFDFMPGILVPDDFNTMSSAEITQLFS